MEVKSYREYDRLVPEGKNAHGQPGVFTLPCKAYEALRNYVESAVDSADFFKLARNRELGEYISLQNYVGAIRLPGGVQLEILPKISGVEATAHEKARRRVLDMLSCLKHLPFQRSGTAMLHTARMALPDLFIRMFLDEVQRLVHSGIRADYVPQRGNLNRVRGRILPTEQLRHNLLHPERIFCAYDEYHRNCPENRLVKATLLTLRRRTTLGGLQRDINRLLGYFEDVQESTAYAADFSRVRQDRNRREYTRLMEWAWVFLFGHSFTNYSGSCTAQALLFPMERLFEAYTAYHVSRHFSKSGWEIKVQDASRYLFESDKGRAFRLHPDIVLRHRTTGRVVVMDTKWKQLEQKPKEHYGVSSADVYQMCAYASRLRASQVYLLYPRSEWMNAREPVHCYTESPTGATITIFPLDLMEDKGLEESLSALAAELENGS